MCRRNGDSSGEDGKIGVTITTGEEIFNLFIDTKIKSSRLCIKTGLEVNAFINQLLDGYN